MTRRIVIPARRGRSGHAQVARSIGIDIISGRFREGDKLPGDAELTSAFAISRPVLREAVKTLVAKGLLSTRARIGTLVRERSAWNMFDPDVVAWHLDAGVDPGFLADIAEIRMAIEPRAASLAAERRESADLEAMQAALARMRSEAQRGTAAFAEADLELHLAIAHAAGNPFMRSIGAVIGAALRASFLLSVPIDARDYEATVAAHERIVTAIAGQDAAAAAEAMANVILHGLRRHGQVPEPRIDS